MAGSKALTAQSPSFVCKHLATNTVDLDRYLKEAERDVPFDHLHLSVTDAGLLSSV